MGISGGGQMVQERAEAIEKSRGSEAQVTGAGAKAKGVAWPPQLPAPPTLYSPGAAFSDAVGCGE